jgi:long-chain acyl-CoA synthetase
MMRNRPEFHIVDLGCLLLGAVPVSVYMGSSSRQVYELLIDCDARTAVFEDSGCAEKLATARAEDRLDRLVVVDDAAASAGVATLSALLGHPALDVQHAIEARTPGDLITICYTSGTTGRPKGVMHSHRAACYWIESLHRALGADVAQHGVSYLPMTTMVERLVCHYLPLRTGASVTPCADPAELGFFLQLVKPGGFFGVPMLFERIRSRVLQAIDQAPDRADYLEALAIGIEVVRKTSRRAVLEPALAARYEVVKSKLDGLRALLGLSNCRFASVGAAPIAPELVEFYLALGVPLGGSYGLTEVPAVALELGHFVPGSSGRAMPGCELKVLPDGEVLCRAGQTFECYVGDAATTASVLDEDGWFHTGDIGRIDEEGNLYVVGRKKELIITASGRNVSPAAVESALAECELISQACVVGDNQEYLAALVTIDEEAVRSFTSGSGEAEDGAPAEHHTLIEQLRTDVRNVNARLSTIEQIRRLKIVPDTWSPDTGELTLTLKLRRPAIHAKYGCDIESLFQPTPAAGVIEIAD